MNISDNVFIGNGAIVLPGVTIGKNVVVGAGSAISRSIPDNSIVVGNPAKVMMIFTKNGENIQNSINVWITYWIDKTEDEKNDMRTQLSIDSGIGYDV